MEPVREIASNELNAAEARRQFYRAAAANEQVVLLGRAADRDPEVG